MIHNSIWQKFPVGQIVFASIDTPIFNKGMLGVVYEHYEGHEGEHFSIMFINGEKEGFAPSDINIFLKRTKENIVDQKINAISSHKDKEKALFVILKMISENPNFNYEIFLINEEKELLENSIKENQEAKKLKI